MFASKTQQTKGAKAHRLTGTTAAIGVVGLIGGLVMVTPMAASATSASAASTTATWAQGQFLSGSLAGMNLSTIAQLTPATARNDGTQSTQEVVDPLAVSLLGSQPINVGSVRVSPDDVLNTSSQGGVLSQYARASKAGDALGASGTVGDGGAIGPNASNPGGALTVSLDTLLGNRFAAAVTDLKLQVQAVAAQAQGNRKSVSGDYYLDGLTLRFTSPALAKVSQLVRDAVSGADSHIDSLTGSDGELAVALRGVLLAANPALDLGAGAHVSVTLQHDLSAAVESLLTATWGGNGVSVNLTTGQVAVDLEALVGDLNNLPVNTELLSAANVSRIVSTISGQIDELTHQLTARLDAALRAMNLDVHADVTVLTDQAPLIGQTCQYQDSSGNVLSDVLGKILGTLVCTTTTTLLPQLETSVNVDVHGTVAHVLNGQAPVTATAKVLGVPLSLSTANLLNRLGLTLGNRLFGSTGILSGLHTALNGPLAAQSNVGLLGSGGVTGLLTDVLSLRVNLQETTLTGGGGMSVATNTKFTETALRVAVARGAGNTGLTTLNVAAASVAPSVKNESGTTTGPGDQGGPGSDGDPGTDNGNPTGTSLDAISLTRSPLQGAINFGNLAYTGVSIGVLLSALLALLTLGVWMAREGYRRNHPPLES